MQARLPGEDLTKVIRRSGRHDRHREEPDADDPRGEQNPGGVPRVLDPADLSFPFKEAALFQDLESGRELYIEPDAMRAKYQQRFAEHRTALTTARSSVSPRPTLT